MENYFSEVRKASNSCTYELAGYILKSPKINVWSDWIWLFGDSSKTIVMFTFNMLLLNVIYFQNWKRFQTHLLM